MILLISGASHTGKTCLAQRLLEKLQWPYYSIDHLKMGLIRSGQTSLTPSDDRELTEYLWPILRELIKTAIENSQNLILEGCYIPFSWKNDFTDQYLEHIRFHCLIMSPHYIERHFDRITEYATVIEARIDDAWVNKDQLIRDNQYYLEHCLRHNLAYTLIDEVYPETGYMVDQIIPLLGQPDS